MKSGWKWATERAVTEAEERTPNKGHRRCGASGRAGLGNIVHRHFSTQEPKGRREIVIEDVRAIDKERR